MPSRRTSSASQERHARRAATGAIAARDAVLAGSAHPAGAADPGGSACRGEGPARAGDAVRVSSPGSLLAVIPLLLGFRPQESIVVIGTEPPRSAVRVTLRYDLPDPADAGQAAAAARHVAGVLAAQQITTAVAAGYGPDALVRPAALALLEHLPAAGIMVGEVLRAEDGRYWSYVCANPGCCPPEGTPFSLDGRAGAEALGGAPVLASREMLAATIAPVTGDEAKAMDRATRAAQDEACEVAGAAGPGSRRARIAAAGAGVAAVQAAVRAYRGGGVLSSHEEAARLLVALHSLRVRDDAWARMDPAHQQDHLRLWTDLTRLARRGHVAAPASLLAFVAWQGGNGALANLALDRALADAPDYSMAALLRRAIDSGAPPSMARLPMTPEEVAASYDADNEDDSDGDGQPDGGETAVQGEEDAPAGDGGRPGLAAG